MPVEPTRSKRGNHPATVVELENSSWVVERGVRHTEWFVKLGDAWTHLADVPAAASSRAEDDPEDGVVEPEGRQVLPPGCQYLIRFRLVLPHGTPVRRRVSMPRDGRRARRASAGAVGTDLKRDILSFFRYTKPPLAVVETEFRVVRAGLVTLQRWERARSANAAVGAVRSE